MDAELLRSADRVVAGLSPSQRESVREIVIDAVRHGRVHQGARAYLDSVTGSALVAQVLESALGQEPRNPG
jgi:hypothetical protein